MTPLLLVSDVLFGVCVRVCCCVLSLHFCVDLSLLFICLHDPFLAEENVGAAWDGTMGRKWTVQGEMLELWLLVLLPHRTQSLSRKEIALLQSLMLVAKVDLDGR